MVAGEFDHRHIMHCATAGSGAVAPMFDPTRLEDAHRISAANVDFRIEALPKDASDSTSLDIPVIGFCSLSRTSSEGAVAFS